MHRAAKAILSALVLVGVAGAVSAVWVSHAVKREVEAPITTLNVNGQTGKSLIVHHPGLTGFQEQVTAAFAEGLAQSGWRVDRTTASRQAPSDVSGYDLIVLGSPVYGGAAAVPLRDYIARVADFQGKPVALLLTAAGDADDAMEATAAAVTTERGKVVARLGYTTMRPNKAAATYSGSNSERAVAMARDAARALAPRAGGS
ncbi:MAG: hypothetical protein NW223_02010 [Hyphomicrobiaceae bacterium]|nr:hypothetical protein [Hyphomicrobiaceae bacterium]